MAKEKKKNSQTGETSDPPPGSPHAIALELMGKLDRLADVMSSLDGRLAALEGGGSAPSSGDNPSQGSSPPGPGIPQHASADQWYGLLNKMVFGEGVEGGLQKEEFALFKEYRLGQIKRQQAIDAYVTKRILSGKSLPGFDEEKG